MDPSLIKSQLSAWKLHTSEFKELQKIARALMKSGDRELIRIGAELLSCGVAHETFGDLNLRRFLVCADIIFFLVQGPEWIADKNTSFRMSQLHKFDAEFEINKRQLWPTLKEGDLDLAGLAPGTYVREVLESASKMQLEAGISVDEIHPLPEYISSAAGADHVSPELEAGVRLHIVL